MRTGWCHMLMDYGLPDKTIRCGHFVIGTIECRWCGVAGWTRHKAGLESRSTPAEQMSHGATAMGS